MTNTIEYDGETWENIDLEEFNIYDRDSMEMNITDEHGCLKQKFFKKAEKFPKVFEQTGGYKLEVDEVGNLTAIGDSGVCVTILNKPDDDYEKDLKALELAIAESKRIRENNK